MKRLIIQDDDGKTTVLPFLREELTIGRAEGNTIRLVDINVSRHHACIRQYNGRFFIQDRWSSTGIYINDILMLQDSLEFFPGDEIKIGNYQLTIQNE